ncbi:Cysteine-rich secretory protein family protein [Lutibacter oricola]|uniref:Cysteine-rich secretory protein family protein n=1 Tax=Lutibacter oricola TaxID=762486 RepID=A0A1H3EH64_9FLAO|nr:CAP domain-containing protein [Lutibacter oricola]SDX77264.1 Cysteine-rich secretory protein family protein [Lutibacter oricola]
MKTNIQLILPLLVLSFLSFSCSTENNDDLYSQESEITIDASTVTYTSLESNILDLVNAHRTSIGLNDLEILNLVSSVAEEHTMYMIENGQISHDNFDDRAQQLMSAAKAKSVAENVAFGYSTAEGVLEGWLNSDSHRAAIENSKFTHFGISTECNNNGRNYFTNIFIKK